MLKGKPIKDATTGEWGAVIDQEAAPHTGEQVAITTRAGSVFTKVIMGVDPARGKFGWRCTTGSKGKGLVKTEERKVVETKIDEGAIRELIRETVAQELEGFAAPKEEKKGGKLALSAGVKKFLAEEAAKLIRPITITVVTPKETNKVEGAHYLFPRLVQLMGAGLPVFLWGPPGTGKTTAALQAAKALGREAEIDTLDPTTARSMIQGYMNPQGEAVHQVFTRCWTAGKVYVADEVDLAPGHTQTLFNSALANDAAPLAWGNVAKADNFSFVATGNTSGRPTAAFPDRRPMSNAFADRLYFLHWPLDASIECRAVGLPAPEVAVPEAKPCEPQRWVQFVQGLRKWAVEGAPTLSITPRASLLGIQALALGETPAQVADGLIFRGCDPTLRAKCLQNVSWI